MRAQPLTLDTYDPQTGDVLWISEPGELLDAHVADVAIVAYVNVLTSRPLYFHATYSGTPCAALDRAVRGVQAKHRIDQVARPDAVLRLSRPWWSFSLAEARAMASWAFAHADFRMGPGEMLARAYQAVRRLPPSRDQGGPLKPTWSAARAQYELIWRRQILQKPRRFAAMNHAPGCGPAPPRPGCGPAPPRPGHATDGREAGAPVLLPIEWVAAEQG